VGTSVPQLPPVRTHRDPTLAPAKPGTKAMAPPAVTATSVLASAVATPAQPILPVSMMLAPTPAPAKLGTLEMDKPALRSTIARTRRTTAPVLVQPATSPAQGPSLVPVTVATTAQDMLALRSTIVPLEGATTALLLGPPALTLVLEPTPAPVTQAPLEMGNPALRSITVPRVTQIIVQVRPTALTLDLEFTLATATLDSMGPGKFAMIAMSALATVVGTLAARLLPAQTRSEPTPAPVTQATLEMVNPALQSITVPWSIK